MYVDSYSFIHGQSFLLLHCYCLPLHNKWLPLGISYTLFIVTLHNNKLIPYSYHYVVWFTIMHSWVVKEHHLLPLFTYEHHFLGPFLLLLLILPSTISCNIIYLWCIGLMSNIVLGFALCCICHSTPPLELNFLYITCNSALTYTLELQQIFNSFGYLLRFW